MMNGALTAAVVKLATSTCSDSKERNRAIPGDCTGGKLQAVHGLARVSFFVTHAWTNQARLVRSQRLTRV
jgi:hypothetical protein